MNVVGVLVEAINVFFRPITISVSIWKLIVGLLNRMKTPAYFRSRMSSKVTLTRFGGHCTFRMKAYTTRELYYDHDSGHAQPKIP